MIVKHIVHTCPKLFKCVYILSVQVPTSLISLDGSCDWMCYLAHVVSKPVGRVIVAVLPVLHMWLQL